MKLFGFGKKKEESCCGSNPEVVKGTCSCGGECGISDIENARFIVLGACCKKSADTFENTKKAVAELGFSDEVLNIGDTIQIAKYGVMQTPALVIESKVMAYGKLLSVDEVKKLIEKSGVKINE
ncbi:MAG: thioredoxin family protein [Lachnospiraceae bacterium]